ncbi:MAG: glycosyltransferase family 4 protein [Verrucomicrobiota bacterium]|nr:glycosyltransferase family 4 protein [Verrucomicrobiota bacterium]
MRIGFVSTRFHGTDGVSLEASKWARVLEEELDHECFWFAGKLDTPEHSSSLCPKAFFEDPSVISLQEKLFSNLNSCPKDLDDSVNILEREIYNSLENFIREHSIDLVIPQNVLAIPMHVPMGLAVTNLAANGLPMVAHHHDFYWERERFLKGCAQHYLDFAFPPKFSEKFQHVVINSRAKESLMERLELESTVIPNVFDFENPPSKEDDYGDDFRDQFQIESDEILILQPTRIVPRKGIELSIELCSRIQERTKEKICLVVSHLAGDEGMDYYYQLVDLSERLKVKVIWAGERVGEFRGLNSSGEKLYKLWDVYPHADFVTYPSLYEGFGNALLETFYFSKPVLVNRYPVFKDDIEPCGFKVVSMDSEITDEVVSETIDLILDKDLARQWTQLNYDLCMENFSYKVLRNSLENILNELMTSND